LKVLLSYVKGACSLYHISKSIYITAVVVNDEETNNNETKMHCIRVKKLLNNISQFKG
jgi:hypothetical protein